MTLTDMDRRLYSGIVKAALRKYTDSWRFGFTALDGSFDVYNGRGEPIFKIKIEDPSPTGHEKR